MKITFLGTNGWFDSPTGNTVCALAETKDFYAVLDAGSGFAKLGQHLKHTQKPVYIFLSHLHLDHIIGLHTITLLTGHDVTIFCAQKYLSHLQTFLNHPFTAPLTELKLNCKIVGLAEGGHTIPFNFEVLPLQHIDYDLGFRFYWEKKVITYCSDTSICKNDQILSTNADLLIHECAFASGEISDWGHTTPEQAATMAKDADAKKLILTHFGANRYNTEKKIKDAEKIAKKIFPQTIAARDGMTIKL